MLGDMTVIMLHQLQVISAWFSFYPIYLKLESIVIIVMHDV